jgi:aquaporin Z
VPTVGSAYLGVLTIMRRPDEFVGTTHKSGEKAVAGIAIGASLTAIHLVGIPLTGTGVNPARSLAPALFAGSPPLTQVWLFLVAPLVGAVLAALVHEVTHPALAAIRAARASAAEAETAARAVGQEG